MVWQFLLGLFGGSATGGVLNSVNTRIQRATNNLDPVQILSAASYADAYRIDTITKDQYYQYMKDLGYTSNQAKVFYNNTRVFLSKEDNAIRRIAKTFDTVFTDNSLFPKNPFQPSRLNGIKEEYCRQMYGIGFCFIVSNTVHLTAIFLFYTV